MKTGARSSAAGSGRRSDATGARRERLASGAHPLLSVALPAWRSKLMLFMLFVGFVALGGRAFFLMGGVTTEFLQRQGEARYARTLEIPATRGRITDRNGVVLASSVPARAVWAIPEDVSGDTGTDRRAGAPARHERGRAEAAARQRGSQLRLSAATGGHAGRGPNQRAEDCRYSLESRVQASLSGRPDQRAHCGLHQCRRPRAGGHRARSRAPAGRAVRESPRHQGPAGTRRRGRLAARAGRWPRPRALDRQPGAVHRLLGAEERDRQASGEGGRGDRSRCTDRRGARAGQFADIRSECAWPAVG